MKSAIIKPWRESAGLPPDYPLTCATFVETHMEKEIKGLREALGGAPSAASKALDAAAPAWLTDAVEALRRVCAHDKRSSEQINRDWDHARSVLARIDGDKQGAQEGALLGHASATTPEAEGEDTKPIDCSSDPSNCPDNEGYGCHCSASAPDEAKGVNK